MCSNSRSDFWAVAVVTADNSLASGPSVGTIVQRDVSQSDIDDAKNQRDQANEQAQEAASMVSQLSGEQDSLSGRLAELNAANEEQKAQYEQIAAQLEAALEAKAQALDEYISAQENLEAQELLFSQRVSVMFEYQNKSTLDVLLESDSIAGFYKYGSYYVNR